MQQELTVFELERETTNYSTWLGDRDSALDVCSVKWQPLTL